MIVEILIDEQIYSKIFMILTKKVFSTHSSQLYCSYQGLIHSYRPKELTTTVKPVVLLYSRKYFCPINLLSRLKKCVEVNLKTQNAN